MKKTYVTTVPNHIGAFLSASRLLAALDVNITRVSYNKAVDSHTIFIEAEGSRQQLAQADEQLAAIGYLRSGGAEKSVVLLEFQLRDVPGGVTDILACIERFGFNISYLSSQENGTDYQLFKMGLFVEDPARIHAFLREARALCPVRVIDYDRAEKTFDNSIFYDSFVSGLCRAMDLPESARPSLLVNANLAMQTLDERGLSPYRTFDSIRRFAELLSQSRGERFLPRVTNCRLTDETALTLIEPPCGSNTAILTHGEDVLFIDSGYACYRPEMLTLFRRLVPNFDARKKTILITHADVDHCGLLPEFDEVLLSAKSAECLRLEAAGQDGYRERNPLHKPYIQICKCLTGYRPPDTDRLRVLWGGLTPLASPLEPIGRFAFGDLDFEVRRRGRASAGRDRPAGRRPPHRPHRRYLRQHPRHDRRAERVQPVRAHPHDLGRHRSGALRRGTQSGLRPSHPRRLADLRRARREEGRVRPGPRMKGLIP